MVGDAVTTGVGEHLELDGVGELGEVVVADPRLGTGTDSGSARWLAERKRRVPAGGVGQGDLDHRPVGIGREQADDRAKVNDLAGARPSSDEAIADGGELGRVFREHGDVIDATTTEWHRGRVVENAARRVSRMLEDVKDEIAEAQEAGAPGRRVVGASVGGLGAEHFGVEGAERPEVPRHEGRMSNTPHGPIIPPRP